MRLAGAHKHVKTSCLGLWREPRGVEQDDVIRKIPALERWPQSGGQIADARRTVAWLRAGPRDVDGLRRWNLQVPVIAGVVSERKEGLWYLPGLWFWFRQRALAGAWGGRPQEEDMGQGEQGRGMRLERWTGPVPCWPASRPCQESPGKAASHCFLTALFFGNLSLQPDPGMSRDIWELFDSRINI